MLHPEFWQPDKNIYPSPFSTLLLWGETVGIPVRGMRADSSLGNTEHPKTINSPPGICVLG